MDMGECLSSRDGSNTTSIEGLQVRSEPCVWCNGMACKGGGKAMCEPFDYAMHGQHVNFTLFGAAGSYRIANCEAPIQKPDWDYSCLKEAAGGCRKLKDPFSCLGAKDGSIAPEDGLAVKGEPCVWCGGGACTDSGYSLCEPFNWVMNGEGRAFQTFHAKFNYRFAAYQNGHAMSATLTGFKNFTPGMVPTIAPEWWVPEKPVGDDVACLMNHRYGCHVIKDKETCLGSYDGQNA